MFKHIFLFVLTLNMLSFGQYSHTNAFSLDSLTPEQRSIAENYISSNEKIETDSSDTVIQTEDPVQNTQEESTTTSKNITIKKSSNLSSIEQIYNDIDTDHDLLIKKKSIHKVEEKEVYQIGYNIFNRKRDPIYKNFSGNKAVPKNYRLSDGDKLTAFLYGKKEEVMELTIDSSGDIFFPSIGPIKISGLTLDEAMKKIKDSLSKKYVNFSFKLILNSVESVRITVTGDIKNPGVFPVEKFDSLIQILADAGGVNKTGSLRNIKIISSSGKTKVVDLYNFIVNSKNNKVIFFNSGDTIFIPKISDTVAIKGAIKSPGIYEVKPDETIDDLINFANGYNINAYKNAIYINRMDNFFNRKVSVIFNNDYSKVLDEIKSKKLNNGDLIVIRSRSDESYGYVNIQGNVNIEGKYEFIPGITLKEIIKQARGFKENSFNEIQVYRYMNENQRELLNINLSNDSFEIKNRDVLRVFNNYELAESPSINVSGEVMFPGDYIFAKGMSLKDILLLAQPKNFSSLVNIELTRFDTELSSVIYLNIKDDSDFKLMPNDKINIKLDNLRDQTCMIELKGEIRYPGIYRVNKGTKLSQVIDKAGGYTDRAFLDGALFLRKDIEFKNKIGQEKVIEDEKKRFIYDQSHLGNLSMDSQVSLGVMMSARQEALKFLEEKTKLNSGRIILDLKSKDFETSMDNFTIQDGDILEIPESPESVHLIGGVQQGISIAYNKNYSINSYVNNVGGYTKYADRHNIYVFKSSGKVIKNDREITPGDIIYVPENVNISFNWLQFLTNITSIISNAVTSIALIQSLQ